MQIPPAFFNPTRSHKIPNILSYASPTPFYTVFQKLLGRFFFDLYQFLAGETTTSDACMYCCMLEQIQQKIWTPLESAADEVWSFSFFTHRELSSWTIHIHMLSYTLYINIYVTMYTYMYLSYILFHSHHLYMHPYAFSIPPSTFHVQSLTPPTWSGFL